MTRDDTQRIIMSKLDHDIRDDNLKSVCLTLSLEIAKLQGVICRHEAQLEKYSKAFSSLEEK